MSDDKFGGKPLTNDDDYDYDNYDSYSGFDDYKFSDFDYDEDEADDDEKPLTSVRSEASGDYEKPLEKINTDRNRPPTRRETIKRVAEEHQNGITRKPGVTPPDTRLARRKGESRSPYTSRMSDGAPRTNTARPKRNPPPQKSAVTKKTKFAVFYIVLLMLAVGVCLTVLLTVLNNMEGALDSFPIIGAGATPTPPPETEQRERADMRSLTALITSIDPFGAQRTLTLLDINSRRTQEFIVSDDVRMSNRGGHPITFPELRIGNIVDIGFDARNSEIITLNESRNTWERRNRTNTQVDIDNFTVSLGNESWNFNSQTLVLFRGENFPISQIRPIDSVTMVGQDDIVWLIQIDVAHGYLQFTNADMVVNGRIMINNDMLFALDDISTDIELPEGTHRIMVEGDNIEMLQENITITQGQTTRFNLGGAQLRAALLHIAVTPSDALIFVNGELHDNTEPAQVEFGENHVRVERDGYLPQEERFEVEASPASLVFNLIEILSDHTLVIFTVPNNAEIFIDNLFVGHSTLTHSVNPGTYSVVARLPGYESAQISIVVTGDETEDVRQYIMLTPETSDPLSNLPPEEVEPIPDPTPTPFPTLPPEAPFPTLPPDATPTPTPLPPVDDIPPPPDWW